MRTICPAGRPVASLRSHRALAVFLLAVLSVVVGLSSVDAASAATLCRASAARAVTGSATSEPTVANPSTTPCTTQDNEAAGTQPVGGMTVSHPQASTRAAEGLLAATASVDGANLTAGLVPLSVGHVEAEQLVSCDDDASETSGSSTVDGLTVAGTPITVVGDEEIDETIAGVRVRTNQVTGDTRQALVIDTPDTQYVLGEARAGGDACETLDTEDEEGDGGSGGGGDFSKVCPTGATYDAATNQCVITADGTTTVIGGPFGGPSGGTVVTLTQALAMVKAGTLVDSPCLYGAGPKFVVLGNRKSDLITGTNAADRIVGAGGNDKLDGGRGDDCVDGGSGGDTVAGGQANDRVYGSTGKDHVNGGQGHDREWGGTGNDTINTGYGADRVDAGPGDDAINAATNGPAARIRGGSGRDTVRINLNERRHVRGGERVYVIR